MRERARVKQKQREREGKRGRRREGARGLCPAGRLGGWALEGICMVTLGAFDFFRLMAFQLVQVQQLLRS